MTATSLKTHLGYHCVSYRCPVHGLICREVPACVDSISTCPVCTEEEIKKKEQEELAERARRAEGRYIIGNIRREYRSKTLTDYTPVTDSQQKALKAVQSLITDKHGKIILLGTNGVGKTFLGSMAVKALGGKILTMYEISAMIRATYNPRAQQTELELVSELAELPLLVIDEIGRTKGSDMETNWLSYILDRRHTEGLPFVLLSNAHLGRNCSHGGGCDMCFESYLGTDILSRLREDSVIIEIMGPDHRKTAENDRRVS